MDTIQLNSTQHNENESNSTNIYVLITQVLINILVILFHSCGLYLLVKVKKDGAGNMVVYTNRKLLILLSISQFFNGVGRVMYHNIEKPSFWCKSSSNFYPYH